MFQTNDPAYIEAENNHNAKVVKNLRQFVENLIRVNSVTGHTAVLKDILAGGEVKDNRSPATKMNDWERSIVIEVPEFKDTALGILIAQLTGRHLSKHQKFPHLIRKRNPGE